jgi:hypothetical protein
MKTADKILIWAPRLICILAIFSISLLAADSFGPGRTIWQQLGAFFMHLIPAIILLALLLVAWKWELIGGIIFTATGIGFSPVIFLINYNINRSVWISLGTILTLTVPIVLAGILFIAGYYRKKRR